MQTADLAIRRGLRNRDQNPMRTRLVEERLGARWRERVSMSNCCLRRRFSARTAFVPPGPRSLARVVKKEAKRRKMIFMLGSVGQGDGEPQGDGMPI